jgi:hypothetical protein
LTASERQDRVLAEARLIRGVTIKIGSKVIGVGLMDFLLVRVWGPNLINRHQDLALAGSIACFLAAFVATVWLAFQLWIDLRRFGDARRQLRRVHHLKLELK